MLIHSASQLLTLAGGPQRGNQLGTLRNHPKWGSISTKRPDRGDWTF